MLRLDKYPNMICAMRLYRAARAGHVPPRVAIGELYDYLVQDDTGPTNPFSKVHLGSIVINSVWYEPRKTFQQKPRARSVYLFHDKRDLIFGLEWMLCMFFKDYFEKVNREEISDEDEMESALDDLANVTQAEYEEFYEFGIYQFTQKKIDWALLSYRDGWKFEENIPVAKAAGWRTRPKISSPQDLS